MKFFGHKLRKSATDAHPSRYATRIGKAWRVAVWWVSGSEQVEQENPPVWRASLKGLVKVSATGSPGAADALKALEGDARRAYEELGKVVPRRDAHPPWA